MLDLVTSLLGVTVDELIAPEHEGRKVSRTAEEILPDPSTEPHSLADIIGQDRVVRTLKGLLGVRPYPHTLLATGAPGAGKSCIARALALDLGSGVVELAGKITPEDLAEAVKGMVDDDMLLLDEAHETLPHHTNVWLNLMQDGRFSTKRGQVQAPKVTVVATTTHASAIPEAILTRFMLRPVFEPVTDDSMLKLARRFSDVICQVSDETLTRIANVSNGSTRQMKSILWHTKATGSVDEALDTLGLTTDGLNSTQVAYLVLLHMEGPSSLKTIQSRLNEPELGLDEKGLLRRGLITITSRGREITDRGRNRMKELTRS